MTAEESVVLMQAIFNTLIWITVLDCALIKWAYGINLLSPTQLENQLLMRVLLNNLKWSTAWNCLLFYLL